MTRRSFKCPICGGELQRDNEDFPFCSARCRQIDLGNWAGGNYAIPGEPATGGEQEEDSEPRIH